MNIDMNSMNIQTAGRRDSGIEEWLMDRCVEVEVKKKYRGNVEAGEEGEKKL